MNIANEKSKNIIIALDIHCNAKTTFNMLILCNLVVSLSFISYIHFSKTSGLQDAI